MTGRGYVVNLWNRRGGEQGVIETLDQLKTVVDQTHQAAIEREAAYFTSHKD